MDMTIKDEIEQLILRCIASDGLKACPKDLAFLEKYGLKNLFFFSVEYGMEGADTQSLDSNQEWLLSILYSCNLKKQLGQCPKFHRYYLYFGYIT